MKLMLEGSINLWFLPANKADQLLVFVKISESDTAGSVKHYCAAASNMMIKNKKVFSLCSLSEACP